MSNLAPKWVRFAPSWTNPRLVPIRFQYIWPQDWKSLGFAPFWANLTYSDAKTDMTAPNWSLSGYTFHFPIRQLERSEAGFSSSLYRQAHRDLHPWQFVSKFGQISHIIWDSFRLFFITLNSSQKANTRLFKKSLSIHIRILARILF